MSLWIINNPSLQQRIDCNTVATEVDRSGTQYHSKLCPHKWTNLGHTIPRNSVIVSGLSALGYVIVSNHLSEGDSSSSSSIAKGTFVAPPVPVSSSTPESDASDSTLANTTTDQTYQGTGNGAPRVSTKSADNKERLRQQLRDAIAATDDPDVKKKLQERLDGLK